jgi:RNA polymerase sigma-70 factor (family 1)
MIYRTEAEVAEGLKRKDTRILAYLVEKYYASICYFALRYTSNREEAEDIVIRVFSAFWEKCENFDTEQNVKAYLYISTKNNCLTYLRNSQKRREFEKEYPGLVDTVAEDQFERLQIEAELMRKIHTVIENLPAKCKEVFKLAYFEDLKTSEIASRLGISESTVLSQKSNAIKVLKLALLAKGLLFLCLLSMR